MGSVCDPLSDNYDPGLCQIANPFPGLPGFLPGEGGGSSGGGSTVVIVTPPPVIFEIPPSFGTTIANSIGGVVQKAIENTGKTVDSVLQAITAVILGGIGDAVNNIGKFLKGALDAIAGVVTRLATSITTILGTVFAAVVNAIGAAARFVGTAIKDIGTEIGGKIERLISEIRAGNLAAIAPALIAMVQIIGQVRNAVAAVELAIKGGLNGVLIGIQGVAHSIGSIDATLNRALTQIGFAPGAQIGSTVQFPNGQDPTPLFLGISNMLAPDGPPSEFSPVWLDLVTLSTACKKQEAASALLKLGDTLGQAPAWLAWIGRIALDVINTLVATGGIIEKQVELALEDANKVCPIKKLDPATAVQAAIRKFIDPGALKEELNAQGYDDNRIRVLLDLASQRLDVGIIVDSLYRGIISDADFSTGLHAFAFTDSQIAVIREQAKVLPQVTDVLRWLDFGLIQRDDAIKRLSHLHIPSDSIDAILQSYQTRETVQQRILLNGRLNASGAGYAPQTFSLDTPLEVLQSAQREQINPGNARLQWLAHWQLPSYVTMIQSFFRQMRTTNDVQLSMMAENIPQEFWDELVEINRPLLPFRSIPGYVKAGILSEGDAILELTKHGFDPLHVKWILDFAHKTSSKTASAAVSEVSQLSVQTARTLFDDGAITEDQYISVLEAHKFPPDVAKLQADADAMAFHAKQRKQQIIDMQDEVLAGAISVDDALTNLHKGGFTAAEIARFQKGIRKAQTTSAKHPSIAELKTFLKAQVIDLTQFKNELQLQGWQDPWLSAFVKLETPPA